MGDGAEQAAHALGLGSACSRSGFADFYVWMVASGTIRDHPNLLKIMNKYEQHDYDVVVVGAGGAGLRAAIEASARGAKTALVCKSLLGKAHTVMAEGGVAAALASADARDSWQVHFRDTMRGGKFLNQWRMAQLHAQEAPDAGPRAPGVGGRLRPDQGRQASSSATSAVTPTPGSPTSATGPAWR